jgi:hypothetical protein
MVTSRRVNVFETIVTAEHVHIATRHLDARELFEGIGERALVVHESDDPAVRPEQPVWRWLDGVLVE